MGGRRLTGIIHQLQMHPSPKPQPNPLVRSRTVTRIAGRWQWRCASRPFSRIYGLVLDLHIYLFAQTLADGRRPTTLLMHASQHIAQQSGGEELNPDDH
jgi:hypothetical protein